MEQEIGLWTSKEQKILNDPYFQVLRITERYYELKSRNTGHFWIIQKQYTGKYPVVLYHKHSDKITYYHRHRNTYSVRDAVAEIKEHDQYIANCC